MKVDFAAVAQRHCGETSLITGGSFLISVSLFKMCVFNLFQELAKTQQRTEETVLFINGCIFVHRRKTLVINKDPNRQERRSSAQAPSYFTAGRLLVKRLCGERKSSARWPLSRCKRRMCSGTRQLAPLLIKYDVAQRVSA